MIDTSVLPSEIGLDEASATVLIVDDPSDRLFIGEVLLAAVGLFLLQQYAEAFLRGAGFEEMAERHGKKSRSLLAKLKRKDIDEDDLEQQAIETGAALYEVRKAGSLESAARAEEEVAGFLVEYGVPRPKATQIAKGITGKFLGRAA